MPAMTHAAASMDTAIKNCAAKKRRKQSRPASLKNKAERHPADKASTKPPSNIANEYTVESKTSMSAAPMMPWYNNTQKPEPKSAANAAVIPLSAAVRAGSEGSAFPGEGSPFFE